MVSLHKVLPGLVLGVVGMIGGLSGLADKALGQVMVTDLQGQTLAGSALESSAVDKLTPGVKSKSQARSEAYTRAMLIGYAAAEEKDYNTALINFRRALAARPGDRYARAAIRNMETYLAQQRAEAAKQADIVRLQATLAQAVESNDWACAAASVDNLIPLVPPTSNERARLVAYRGELSGFIQSRANVDQWSTVCPGGRV